MRRPEVIEGRIFRFFLQQRTSLQLNPISPVTMIDRENPKKATEILYRMYASRFDPRSIVWTPANISQSIRLVKTNTLAATTRFYLNYIKSYWQKL